MAGIVVSFAVFSLLFGVCQGVTGSRIYPANEGECSWDGRTRKGGGAVRSRADPSFVWCGVSWVFFPLGCPLLRPPLFWEMGGRPASGRYGLLGWREALLRGPEAAHGRATWASRSEKSSIRQDGGRFFQGKVRRVGRARAAGDWQAAWAPAVLAHPPPRSPSLGSPRPRLSQSLDGERMERVEAGVGGAGALERSLPQTRPRLALGRPPPCARRGAKPRGSLTWISTARRLPATGHESACLDHVGRGKKKVPLGWWDQRDPADLDTLFLFSPLNATNIFYFSLKTKQKTNPES